MSRLVNHERLNRQKRVAWEFQAYDSRTGELKSERNLETTGPNGWDWLQFKGMDNMTWPDLFFRDPHKFWFLSAQTYLTMELTQQALVMRHHASRILVPEKYRDTHDFSIIVDADGVLQDLMILRKDDHRRPRKKIGRKILKRATVFDTLFIADYKNRDQGSKRLSECLDRELFTKLGHKPGPKNYRKWFRDPANFAMGVSTKTH